MINPDVNTLSTAYAAPLLVTSLFASLVVLTKRFHAPYTADSQEGVQKFHRGATPRVGGLAVFAGLLASYGFLKGEASSLLGWALLCGFPAFLVGLIEDITKRVGVAVRLAVTIACGVLASVLTGVSIQSVGVPLIDHALAVPFVAVLFTAFAVGGVANALNIIDGFNGLCSGMSVLAFLGYSAMAYLAGDTALCAVGLAAAATMSGFFLLNWPGGRLFLGDGGAYLTGFMLAWMAVLLMARNPSVSAFAVLLVCTHPVMEVLFSVYRRRLKHMSPGQPDRMHLHSLVMRRYTKRLVSDAWRNGTTGLLMALLSVPPVAVAVFLHDDHLLAAAALLCAAMGYVMLYARIVRHAWCSPLRLLAQAFRRRPQRQPSASPYPVASN